MPPEQQEAPGETSQDEKTSDSVVFPKGELDTDLEKFERWFIQQGNSELVKSERAILTTYWIWKWREKNAPTTG